MMSEGQDLVARVNCARQLSAQVTELCRRYSDIAPGSDADIEGLHSRVRTVGNTILALQSALGGPHGLLLKGSRELLQSLDECSSQLAQVQQRLDPGTARMALSRFGFGTLKWPLTGNEVRSIVAALEQSEQEIFSRIRFDEELAFIRPSVTGGRPCPHPALHSS